MPFLLVMNNRVPIVSPNQQKRNQHEARMASHAWDAMRLWLAVCWEYATTLMCAQVWLLCLATYAA
jgi:hypothetical protein